MSQLPPQDGESPPDGCSLLLSLQSTTEPLRGDDTKIKVVMEMKEGREGGDEGCSGGEVGEWMEKSKPNLEGTQHVIKPAKHGESWIQRRNDAPLEAK